VQPGTVALSPEILHWQPSLSESSGKCVEFEEEPPRVYRLLEHAETLLAGQPTRDHRADAIINLNRAVRRRIALLDAVYDFKRIPVGGKPRDFLDLLVLVGIIRPIMLRELKAVRNAVEHNNAEPPSPARCRELAEFVWYFLSSTTGLLRISPRTFRFSFKEHQRAYDPYWIAFTIDPDVNWKIEVSGWIPANLCTLSPKENWLTVKVDKVEKRQEALDKLAEWLKLDKALISETRDRGLVGLGIFPEDFYLRGSLRGPKEVITGLLKGFFQRV
jgi:hypothetical protein